MQNAELTAKYTKYTNFTEKRKEHSAAEPQPNLHLSPPMELKIEDEDEDEDEKEKILAEMSEIDI